ncbi:hypothetical protein [Vibrio vulnificus]|uniref:hypothetical protein n=1 Tax=Vibrio vulnificus TaxID=672 RepID=UPI0005F26C43|nr:hypothetical protein [Vibrio vulnificus]
MNKIQRLKIENYKRKIKEKYSYLGEIDVYYGDENPEDLYFCKKAHNTDYGSYTRVSIYSNDTGVYLSDNEITQIKNRLFFDNIQIFRGKGNIQFTISYNNENFRLSCDASNFIANINIIDGIGENPKVFSSDHSVMLSILRLEYEIELYIWVKDSN